MANETDGGEVHDPTSTYAVLGLYGVLDITIIAANTLVLFLVYKKRSLRTVTNNFLVSLAVSDLSTGLVAIPSSIACSLRVTLNTCIPMDICIRFLAFSSVTHLTVLTLERYLRITKPFAYRSRVTGTSTYRVIYGMWGFSLFASLIQLSWIKNSSINEEDRIQIEIIYGCVSLALVVVIPLFFITGIYIAIFRFIRRHNARRSEVLAMSTNTPANNKKAKAKNEKKLLLVFLAMIVVFILGSFNYFFWSMLFDLYEYHSIRITDKSLDMISKFTMFFRYSSSLCNPLLLTFFKQDFNEALMSVMGRRKLPREKRITNKEGKNVICDKTTSDVL